jgi:hypothetical protein
MEAGLEVADPEVASKQTRNNQVELFADVEAAAASHEHAVEVAVEVAVDAQLLQVAKVAAALHFDAVVAEVASKHDKQNKQC